jgi:tRNA nucleotidyltransferase/poly(A) polymerase
VTVCRIGAMPLGSVTAKLHALLALIDRDGEEARVVGAAVRSTLLRLPVAEIDVGTTALGRTTATPLLQRSNFRVIPG